MEVEYRPCGQDDFEAILSIVNDAAEKYRGVIPEDCWHDPYMTAHALEREFQAGIQFTGAEIDGRLVAVMGAQPVIDVLLIRHAYVRPEHQGSGIGTALLNHLLHNRERRVLVGTWADATWAIRFYERNGFRLVLNDDKATLLRRYWTIPDRQIEASVVLELGTG